jgi:leucyl-tRNA synthetase
VYTAGFEQGVMKVGEFAGQPVKEAKAKVREMLVRQGLAVMYSEPASVVVSRTGLECFVKNLDQWYLPYGEDEWCAKVRGHVEVRLCVRALAPTLATQNPSAFNAYTATALRTFQQTLDWLKEWACSRSFGLGTELPQFAPTDKKGEFIIESLSDRCGAARN